jgi:hypothetical protein
MGGYAPTRRKGKQLRLEPIDAGPHADMSIACDLCSNPTRTGVVSMHNDGAGVRMTSKGRCICDGCVEELAEYARR